MADQVVVLDRPAVGMKLLAGYECERMQASLRVRQLDSFAFV